MNFFCMTFEAFRIPQRILGILAKEISNGREDRERPDQAMLLGKLKGWAGGFLGRRTTVPSYRKGNIWPWEGGPGGKKQG